MENDRAANSINTTTPNNASNINMKKRNVAADVLPPSDRKTKAVSRLKERAPASLEVKISSHKLNEDVFGFSKNQTPIPLLSPLILSPSENYSETNDAASSRSVVAAASSVNVNNAGGGGWQHPAAPFFVVDSRHCVNLLQP